jgi:hypothetical protein
MTVNLSLFKRADPHQHWLKLLRKALKGFKSIKSIGASYPHAPGTPLSTRGAANISTSTDRQCIDRIACRARLLTTRGEEHRRGNSYLSATVVAYLGLAAQTPLLSQSPQDHAGPARAIRRRRSCAISTHDKKHQTMPETPS